MVALAKPTGNLGTLRKDADELKELLETALSVLARMRRHLG